MEQFSLGGKHFRVEHERFSFLFFLHGSTLWLQPPRPWALHSATGLQLGLKHWVDALRAPKVCLGARCCHAALGCGPYVGGEALEVLCAAGKRCAPCPTCWAGPQARATQRCTLAGLLQVGCCRLQGGGVARRG